MYLDANNLYGVSMVQSLPYKNFKWSNDLTLDKLQTGNYEIDIEIPKELYDKFTIQFLGSRTFNSAQPLIKKGAIKQKNTNFTGNNNRFALRSSSGYKN